MCWRLDGARRGGAVEEWTNGPDDGKGKTHAGGRRGPERNDGGELPLQRRIKESDTGNLV